jgi:hypothetical protein
MVDNPKKVTEMLKKPTSTDYSSTAAYKTDVQLDNPRNLSMPSERLPLKDKITLISEWCLKHKNTLKHFRTGSFVKLCSTIELKIILMTRFWKMSFYF